VIHQGVKKFTFMLVFFLSSDIFYLFILRRRFPVNFIFKRLSAYKAVCVAILFAVGCGAPGDKTATDLATEAGEVNESAAKDFQETLKKSRQAAGMEERAELFEAFAKRNPNTDEGVKAIQWSIEVYYVGNKEDTDAAIAYLNEMMPNYPDMQHRVALNHQLLWLLARSKDVEGVKRTIETIKTALATLRTSDHLSIMDAAMETGDTELTVKHARKVIELATVENYKRENPGHTKSEYQIQKIVTSNKATAYETMAIAYSDAGNTEDALAAFEQARLVSEYNFSGVAITNISLNWAEALIRAGDYLKAMETVAPDAIIQGHAGANDIFKKAYLNSGGSEADFDRVREEWRSRIARKVDGFTVYSYDDEIQPITFAELKGEVTLITFFFPT
jgi:tetratricopeptide (TPR) repeat protein